ncbi:hypothetical protein HK103_003632 [Boothiomyces macroporosus]|uniref:Uncharacterized protein n=1 Tax=Boothiomyces macroporosus TaxID=261099 RepID=A0AAD5Y010_9FUNG|nr:hypothetical protein HK103_003632 [Boothiomyces macroporosus]
MLHGKDMNEIYAELNSLKDADMEDMDIAALLKQMDQANQIMDALEGKTDSLIAKMDEILKEASEEE